jgi:hypothetical protein
MGSLHRVGAAVVGGFVFVFGLAGLAARPEVYSTEGPVVFGMTTNGLLAFASLAVGIVLLFSTVLGGQREGALHHATEEQIERLHEADKYRTAADRRHAWEESDRRHESPSG